jgi:hypothetical protein
MHVDLSWVGDEAVRCGDGGVRSEWIDVVERFADRVLLGSDLVGHFDKRKASMSRYHGLLASLSEAARARVARGNAERLFFTSRPG